MFVVMKSQERGIYWITKFFEFQIVCSGLRIYQQVLVYRQILPSNFETFIQFSIYQSILLYIFLRDLLNYTFFIIYPTGVLFIIKILCAYYPPHLKCSVFTKAIYGGTWKCSHHFDLNPNKYSYLIKNVGGIIKRIPHLVRILIYNKTYC